MKILCVSQIRECDAFTIDNEPILSIDLMERAASRLFEWIALNYDKNCSFVLFAGSGNNGGDALALARLLYNSGFANVVLYYLQVVDTASNDCKTNYLRLNKLQSITVIDIHENDPLPNIDKNSIIIDGIFGSGLSRSVSGYWSKIIKHINLNATTIISIDIPSGLFADNNLNDNKGEIIRAKHTLTFQFPKKAFLFADNNEFVGYWIVLDIGLSKEFISKVETSNYYLQSDYIRSKIKVRNKFAHKGNFGHAFLVAGSYQKTGAAVLAAQGCLRSGVGLLTVHVPQSAYVIMQTAVPEAMLFIDETELSSCSIELFASYSAIGIGPGIGKKSSMQNALQRILENYTKPMVFDADALNILSDNNEMLKLVPKNSILTPHPGEFDRLTKKHISGNDRLVSQIELSKTLQCYVVLKGAYTSVSTPNGDVYFNSTGNSGMATAGSGDVLTGIILSLLAQGYNSKYSALLGVYLHGLSGDIAEKRIGPEALIASDIINSLGNAFIQLKNSI